MNVRISPSEDEQVQQSSSAPSQALPNYSHPYHPIADICSLIALVISIASLILTFQLIGPFISLVSPHHNPEEPGVLVAGFLFAYYLAADLFLLLTAIISDILALAYRNRSDNPRNAKRATVVAAILQVPTFIFCAYVAFWMMFR